MNIVRCFTLYSDYFIELFISSFQEKGGVDTFTHGPLALKYKLDNEFELLFVVSFFMYYVNDRLSNMLENTVYDLT